LAGRTLNFDVAIVNETCRFFTRGPVIGGESISSRASAIINQSSVLFTLPAG